MQEMNQRQYHLSTISIKFAKNIMDILKVENDCQENVVNICKILPYRMEFLENYINNTKEWGIMTKLYPYINENKNAKDESLEIKLLLFIYKVIFQKEDEERFDFLSAELNEIFMKVYKAMFESTKDSLEEKKEISREQLDELTDLKTLTPREKEILYLILEGLNNQEVGDYLNISVHTVKNHVTNIFKKLNVSDRIQAMVKVYRIRFGEELHLDI
ncbi:helix-turn-helix transcriptional regulator [Ureibacillus thermosphaericus]|nr:helix-turn-helix transcriptional regulator [Ureibacillus thermosphaericus]